MPVAPDPFNTREPMPPRGRDTFDRIEARLGLLNPPIAIRQHIGPHPNHSAFSSLVAGQSTLDGISFNATDPKALEAAFDVAQDKWGKKALTSMKEDPDHWALKVSFGKTVGTGYREVWRPEPYQPPNTILRDLGPDMKVHSARFGTAKTSVNFTALHCAVDKLSGKCNVHIDEAGFVFEMPVGGVAISASVYGHFMDELLNKTEFRDWLVGKISNKKAAFVVGEVIRKLSLVFPTASNGFAGLNRTINNISKPKSVLDAALTAGKILRPIGITIDIYESRQFKLQVAGTIADGDRSVTLNASGEW